ncbi:MAG: DUF975 family protein [Clostridia bacterium]|nr:DUF975 family protein [Clostridia bacterium]
MVPRQQLKQNARAQLGGGIFTSAWIVALFVCFVADLILSIASVPGVISNMSSSIDSMQSAINGAEAAPASLHFTFSTGIGSIAAVLLSGPIGYGLNKMFLKQARDGQPMVFTDLFKGFTEDLGTNVLIGLMTSIFTFLWALLFIVPGIVKGLAYSLSLYLKADHPEYDWKTCINESQRLMRGHKGELFVLYLSFIGWYIVGALCLGVGVLWVRPYVEATKAHFYWSLAAADAAAQPAPFAEPEPQWSMDENV